jgi:uncharacterized protein YyaL (SSP411 family)
MLKVALDAYRPYQVVALAAPDDQVAASTLPLLADRTSQDGRATAYVCQQFVCQSPVTDPAALERQIELRKH